MEDARYMTVRQFLVTEDTDLSKSTLYLDGLDEFRSRIEDKNAVIEVIKCLNRMRRPRLRLSCRIADWLGESDLSLFRQYFQQEPFVVLCLETLTKKEMATVLLMKGIKDTDEFFREANRRGLEGLLGNPQTLIMLAEVVAGSDWMAEYKT